MCLVSFPLRKSTVAAIHIHLYTVQNPHVLERRCLYLYQHLSRLV